MKRLNVIPLLSGTLALLMALPAFGQEAAEDDLTDDLARIGLEAPPSLRREKRREARREGYAFTLVGTAAAGYDSNIHKGFSGTFVDTTTTLTENGSTSGAAVFDLGAKLEGLFYLSSRDRMKVSLESMNSPYTKDTSKVSEYTQNLDLFYAHRFRDWGSTIFSGDIKHSNDSATEGAGNDFTRDFESVAYRGRLGHRIELVDGHILKLSYAFKRKDYFEANALDSLDWWRHGPKAQYIFDCSDDVRWKTSYEFQQQLYDEEIAAFRDGDETGSTTEEEHFFHTARTSFEWSVTNHVSAEAGFRFREKDDRFEDFESYYDYEGELTLTWAPTSLLRFEAGQKISHRDYQKRPRVSSGGGTLEFDRYRTSFQTRYEISDNLAVWGLYGFDLRDSNRVGGTSYRSYDQHQASVGVTTAF